MKKQTIPLVIGAVLLPVIPMIGLSAKYADSFKLGADKARQAMKNMDLTLVSIKQKQLVYVVKTENDKLAMQEAIREYMDEVSEGKYVNYDIEQIIINYRTKFKLLASSFASISIGLLPTIYHGTWPDQSQLYSIGGDWGGVGDYHPCHKSRWGLDSDLIFKEGDWAPIDTWESFRPEWGDVFFNRFSMLSENLNLMLLDPLFNR